MMRVCVIVVVRGCLGGAPGCWCQHVQRMVLVEHDQGGRRGKARVCVCVSCIHTVGLPYQHDAGEAQVAWKGGDCSLSTSSSSLCLLILRHKACRCHLMWIPFSPHLWHVCIISPFPKTSRCTFVCVWREQVKFLCEGNFTNDCIDRCRCFSRDITHANWAATVKEPLTSSASLSGWFTFRTADSWQWESECVREMWR